jgi:hypothetical protein
MPRVIAVANPGGAGPAKPALTIHPSIRFFMIRHLPRSVFLMSLCAAALMPAAFAAQSILLSADDFALLGGTTITANEGTTVSNGNIGISPGTSLVGFPPATVSNGSIVATGAVTDQATADLLTASSGLAAMTATGNLTGQNLGGMTLGSGVYKFDSTAGFTGALALDAAGQNNAYWVFQIGSALTTAAGASVSVINLGADGGTGLGIFWNAGTQITTGANNLLLGNFLAGTGVTLGVSNTLFGSVLAQGAISLDAATINAIGGPNGSGLAGGLTYGGGNVIPVPEVPSFVFAASGALLLLAVRRRRKLAN